MASHPPRPSLDALLRPASVAVVGASDDITRIGGRTLHYLLRAPFDGPVYAVNPRRDTVQGVPCYPSLAAIEGTVDVAVMAIPAAAIESSIEACAAKGVQAAIVFSAGFAEIGETGATQQVELAQLAARHGVRLLGPNCLGAYNASSGFYGTFSTSLTFGFPAAGRVGVVSQSGAYGAYVALLAKQRGVHVGYWVTTGNECDIEVAECIAWMAQCDEIDVIAVYCEGVRDGRAFARALELARNNGKPVICLKVGRSEVGAAAAASHTAALAGSDAVFDGVLAQTGAYRARDTQELLDATYACSRGRLPPNPRVGVMTVSGGVGIQMADDAAQFGLDMAPMPDAAQARLKALLPYASVRNPVDVTAQFFNQLELLPEFLDTLLDAGNYGAVVAFYTYVAAVDSMAAPIRACVESASARYPDQLLVLCIVGPPDVVEAYEACGCLVFEDSTRAMRAVAILNHFARNKPMARHAAPAASGLLALPPKPSNEYQAKQYLARAGLSVVEEAMADSADAACDCAQRIGFPVVLKLSGAALAHKTELGGVLLGLDCESAVREGYATLMTRAAAGGVASAIDGVLVARQLSGGTEMIIGVQRDRAFGPLVMVGMGGVLAEMFGDVSFRMAPVDRNEALRMIDSLGARRLLDGVRGQPAADIDALADAMIQLSVLAAHGDDQIESIDVNPIVVLPRGEGAIVLDALLVT